MLQSSQDLEPPENPARFNKNAANQTGRPAGDGEWHLYNIISDAGEAIDLIEVEPARFQRMRSGYEEFTRDNGVMPLREGYTQTGQLLSNFLAERLRVGVIVLLLTLLVLLPFLVAYRVKRSAG
jgi:hypothetical protein